MPPRGRGAASKNNLSAAETLKENELMLARASDEVRQFFRFERPGAPTERRVVYQVQARLPVVADQLGFFHVPVDVLSAPVAAAVPEAISLIAKIRRASGLHGATNNDDDDEDDDDEKKKDSAGNGNATTRKLRSSGLSALAAMHSSVASASSSPEAIHAAQQHGCFAFSRRNSIRDFQIVGNVSASAAGSSVNVSSGSGGGGRAGVGQQSTQQNTNGAASASPGQRHVASADMLLVQKMCLTLPLRTHTARVAKAVHDIALLLAELHDCGFDD